VAPEALVVPVAPAARWEEPTTNCAATSTTTHASHRAEETRRCTVVPTSDSGVDMSGVGQVNEYVHRPPWFAILPYGRGRPDFAAPGVAARRNGAA
jgi:hypothetical protein